MLGMGRCRSYCPRTLAWLQLYVAWCHRTARLCNRNEPPRSCRRSAADHGERLHPPDLPPSPHLARLCGLRASRSCALAWCTARCILAPRCCRAHPHYARPRRPRAGGLSSPRPRPHAVSTGAAWSGRFATAARPASARCVPWVRLSAVAASADRQMRALAARPHRPCLACRPQPLRPAPLLPLPTRPGRRGRCCSPPRPRG